MKQLKTVDLPRWIGNLEVSFLMWLRNGCINTVKLNTFPPSTLTVSHRPYVWESALIWKKKIFCMIKNINSLTKNIQLFFLEYGPSRKKLAKPYIMKFEILQLDSFKFFCFLFTRPTSIISNNWIFFL